MGKITKTVTSLFVGFFMLAVALLPATQAKAWTWSGGLKVWDKTTGVSLSTESFKAKTSIGTNVVFAPEGLGPNAHHFTVMMRDMATGQVVFYQTMKSLWSIQHPREDSTLGWTTFKPGYYWLQVNAYQANGTGAGAYYSVLHVKMMAD